MATHDISLMGAVFPGVPKVILPVDGGGTATFTDVSDTTAAAADVASGKYFYTADGTKTAGTASGGGGGGLVYETGTYTPASDTAQHSISFANSHNEAPFYFLITDATDTYSSTNYTTYLVQYVNSHQYSGVAHHVGSSNNDNYGTVTTRYRNTSASSFSSLSLFSLV